MRATPARQRRWMLAALSGLCVAALSGCALGDGQAATPTTAAPTSSASASSTSGPETVRFDAVTVSTDMAFKPTVTIGDDASVTKSFISYDIVTGTGPAAKPGDKVTVQYVGRGALSKVTFDSSWDRGTPYSFVPKTLTFVAFRDGVPGMRVGGRRLVIVPGALGFGVKPPKGSGLQPNEGLVFVIDLVSIG